MRILLWYHWVPNPLDVACKKKGCIRKHKILFTIILIVVLYGTMLGKESVMATASMSKRRQEDGDETAVRERILEAAFAAFMKSGYATASTLEIATRAFRSESFTR